MSVGLVPSQLSEGWRLAGFWPGLFTPVCSVLAPASRSRLSPGVLGDVIAL